MKLIEPKICTHDEIVECHGRRPTCVGCLTIFPLGHLHTKEISQEKFNEIIMPRYKDNEPDLEIVK